MAVKLSPIFNDAPYVDSSGNPVSGGLLYTYTAGSSTLETTYTTSAGNVANANPIVLNSAGYPSASGSQVQVWLTSGVSYKFKLTTSAAVELWTRDNISGINDTTVSQDQWVSGATPTYISATSFSLVGDQTSTYHVGRMLKSTNSGGTVYSIITASAFGAVTTVTVANYSGTLDSGLSAVSYGLITSLNPSINADMVNRKGTAVASAATTNIWSIAGDYVHITGNTGPITSLGTAPYAGAERTVIFDSSPTLTHNATTLILPGAANIVVVANARMVVRADTTANMIVTSYTKADGTSVVSMVAPRSYLAGCGIANGTDAVNDINIAAGSCTDSTNAVTIAVAAMTGKQLDANWAPGASAGMRNSAVAITDTTYHIYAVSKADGTQDIYAHTSLTVATVITALQAEGGGSAYLYARRIASIVRTGATILAFTQEADYFRLAVPILNVDTTNPGTAAVTSTLTVPVGLNVHAILKAVLVTAGSQQILNVTDIVETDAAASFTASPLGNVATGNEAGGRASAQLQIRTNTSAQVRYRLDVSDASTVVRLVIAGWIDSRGRND